MFNRNFFLIFVALSLIGSSIANAQDRCERQFRSVSYDPWPEQLRQTFEDLGQGVFQGHWQAETCAFGDFMHRFDDYLRYEEMFKDPEEGFLFADTTREFVAVVAEGKNGNPPQAEQFISIPSVLMGRLGVHPNFLHHEAGRTIFAGVAWISRSKKCYPDWPAPGPGDAYPSDYCVDEPASSDEPFTVKFVVGGHGAPLIGTTLKLNTGMIEHSDAFGAWYGDRYLPAALDVEVFTRLMDEYVVISHSDLRATRKVRFIFVDRSGNEGPESTPDDPLPAPRNSKRENSNGSSRRDANICGSASSACPMMNVPVDLVEKMRSGEIDFSQFGEGFFQ